MTIGLGRAWQRWAVVVFGLATLGAISPVVVEPIAEQIRFTVMPDRERDRSSGVVQLFRGFQMSLADMCYNKSTHYQHRGVRYRIACEDTLDNRLKEDQQRHLAATEEATSPPVDAVTDAHEHEDQHGPDGHLPEAGAPQHISFSNTLHSSHLWVLSRSSSALVEDATSASHAFRRLWGQFKCQWQYKMVFGRF